MNLKETVQSGNFLIRKEKEESDRTYIEARTISGDWRITWWENNTIFPLLDSELSVSEGRERGRVDIRQGIHTFLTNLYVFSTQLEEGLLRDEINIINQFTGRIFKIHPLLSDKEDAEILQVMKTVHQSRALVMSDAGTVISQSDEKHITT